MESYYNFPFQIFLNVRSHLFPRIKFLFPTEGFHLHRNPNKLLFQILTFELIVTSLDTIVFALLYHYICHACSLRREYCPNLPLKEFFKIDGPTYELKTLRTSLY